MIVLLAILNDAAILAIAFDRVRGSSRPAAWDLRSVLAVALVIGALGVAETYLLFAVARDVAGPGLAVARTQVLATLIAGFGLFVTPLPWSWVGLVWAYTLFWFLVEDRVKLATYALLARRPARSGRGGRRSLRTRPGR